MDGSCERVVLIVEGCFSKGQKADWCKARMVVIKKVGTAFAAAVRRQKAKRLSLPSQEWRAPILRTVLLVLIKPVGARDVFVSVSKLYEDILLSKCMFEDVNVEMLQIPR